jgi:putative membrane protein
MKNLTYVALVAVLLFSVQACSDRKGRNFNQKAQEDNNLTFVKTAAESGTAEVALSKLAVKNSTNPQILGFAKMMIADHTAAGNELKAIAADQKITATDSLDKPHQLLVDSLDKLTGINFDKHYIQVMAIDHEKAVKLFKAASTTTDKKLADFAQKTLPKLQGHLKEANSLCTGLK